MSRAFGSSARTRIAAVKAQNRFWTFSASIVGTKVTIIPAGGSAPAAALLTAEPPAMA